MPAVRPLAGQPAFRTCLHQLAQFYPPQSVPVRTQKGNPERRTFIWAVAKAFYSHFRDFHVEAISEIVALLWPNTDERNVRHELTAERKAQIAEAAKAEMTIASDAVLETAALVSRAQRTTHTQSSADLTDSQRVQQALGLLASIGDKELATSLVQGLHTVLSDFDFGLAED